MEIGEPTRIITVEPATVPMEQPERTQRPLPAQPIDVPDPVRAPERTPAREPARKE